MYSLTQNTLVWAVKEAERRQRWGKRGYHNNTIITREKEGIEEERRYVQGQRRYFDIIIIPMIMVLVWNMRVPYLYNDFLSDPRENEMIEE